MHITEHRHGLGPGVTDHTRLDGEDGTGIALSSIRLVGGGHTSLFCAHETAVLLLEGAVSVRTASLAARWSRRSIWDDAPHALHASTGAEIELAPETDVELLRVEVANPRRFAPRFAEVREEQRGAGLVGGACHRIVRTLFDRASSDRDADLVLGEVVTPPGRWSSYPPHHHPQPELYHYRFTHPQGYGHAELGERVLKVKPYDTVAIAPGLDHAQAAAPGYGMWYCWAIRHLPGRPYLAPDFTEEHRWVLDARDGDSSGAPSGGGPAR